PPAELFKGERGALELPEAIGNCQLCSDLDVLNARGGFGDGLTVFAQAFDVKLDGFMNQLQDFFLGIRSSDTAGQVRHVGAKTSFTFLDYHSISQFFVPPVYFKPACFRILFNVPGGTSTLGFPDTVTVPGWFGFLNWRWLPFVRAKYHPRSSRSLITSQTFI